MLDHVQDLGFIPSVYLWIVLDSLTFDAFLYICGLGQDILVVSVMHHLHDCMLCDSPLHYC